MVDCNNVSYKVKFRVNNGGGEGTGYFGIKIDRYNRVHEYEKTVHTVF